MFTSRFSTLPCLTFIVLAGISLSGFAADPANNLFPMTTDEAIEAEYTMQVAGVAVGLCCGEFETLWQKNEKYYLKAAIEQGLLPQPKGKEAELGLDKVELLKQRYRPFNPKTIVAPDSPSVEYEGTEVYFYKAAAQKKWEAAPAAEAEKAIKAELLPQLAGK